jgi:hypothetical protein
MDAAMRRLAALTAVALLMAACGQTAKKQAEDLGSIAAEGALVAHDAAEGSTTDAFTRVHSRALRKKADKIEEQAKQPTLERLAERISRALERLADDPNDRDAAAKIERLLEKADKDAGDLEEQS